MKSKVITVQRDGSTATLKIGWIFRREVNGGYLIRVEGGGFIFCRSLVGGCGLNLIEVRLGSASKNLLKDFTGKKRIGIGLLSGPSGDGRFQLAIAPQNR